MRDTRHDPKPLLSLRVVIPHVREALHFAYREVINIIHVSIRSFQSKGTTRHDPKPLLSLRVVIPHVREALHFAYREVNNIIHVSIRSFQSKGTTRHDPKPLLSLRVVIPHVREALEFCVSRSDFSRCWSYLQHLLKTLSNYLLQIPPCFFN